MTLATLSSITRMGADVDFADEKTITVEFFPDRPDLFSVEGIARALRLFLGIDSEPRSYPAPESSGVVLEVDPSHRYALWDLAVVYEKMGMKDKAEEQYEHYHEMTDCSLRRFWNCVD